MKRSVIATTTIAAVLGLGGCAGNPLTDSLSTIQVCTESVGILTEMQDVLRLALANPLGAATYTDRLAELSDQFKALEPQDEALATAHGELSSQIDTVLQTVENPSVSALADLPTIIAETQIALLDYTEACSP